MDVIELTKELIQIESITGSEHEIAQFIASKLDFNEIEMQSVDGFGPNIIARHVPHTDKPIILLNCHMDTVEVMEGWESDPLIPKIEGNKMMGLGSCDMKAGCAVVTDVFNKMVSRDKNVIFTAVSDEEGNSKGSYVLLRKILKEDMLKNPESVLCLIPEDTQETVKLGARGRFVMEINVTGSSAHGAVPHHGINAILDGAKIIGALKDLPHSSHPKMESSSHCVLKIQGGGDSLSVPDKCTIWVDRHTIPNEDENQILSDLDTLLQKLDLNSKYDLSLMKRETPYLEPYFLDENSSWAKKFLSSYEEFYERTPQIGYGKSVGDFNAFGKYMPTIVFGPSGENPHSPNECVYIDSILRCRDFYLKFIDNLK
jgi:acetylornithine deacetylase/succinyl-diaminopimelate desuccinylase-like protein